MKIALMVIYIKYNDLNIIIKGMGFESIIDLLNENLTLKYLSMNKCLIESHGGECIGNGLSKNRVL